MCCELKLSARKLDELMRFSVSKNPRYSVNYQIEFVGLGLVSSN